MMKTAATSASPIAAAARRFGTPGGAATAAASGAGAERCLFCRGRFPTAAGSPRAPDSAIEGSQDSLPLFHFAVSYAKNMGAEAPHGSKNGTCFNVWLNRAPRCGVAVEESSLSPFYV